ncbi:MAG: asparagine synthase (glutamine-hydrolyzing) [Elusimicrobia bacterium]|nr:MAG: asparagine synthase (glutamine-hydrolyzing) [Elusimicrobiota bacterium]
MCGIVGIVHTSPGKVDREALLRSNDLITHRGPDEAGDYCDDRAGLAMRRLSIIDLKTGQQPISNHDETAFLVFNGEIYNFQELRETLEKDGYAFKTKTDTETIMALYEKHGTDCVRFLRGMFAFAIWDKRRERLFVARDRVGKKPLLYTLGEGYFAFASELRSLSVWPGISREINPKAVDLYLSLQYVPSPHTIFKGIYKLPPAHTLVFEKGKAVIERYWDLPMDGPEKGLSVADAEIRILDKLKESVRLRMISDVPLGAFLSGGIDSSVIVALMSELSDKPVKTFSIGFDHEKFSELPYAKTIADMYGCDHNEFVVTAEMAETLPKIAWHYGEPYGDTSALPSYYVSRETRKHVTVALNGDGGDENFAGYIRYFALKAMRLYDTVPGPLRAAAYEIAKRLPEGEAPLGLVWRAKRFFRSAIGADYVGRHLKTLCYFAEEDKAWLYSDAMKRALGYDEDPDRADAERYLRAAYDRSKDQDYVNRMLYIDFTTYLPECLMAKMDIASMANSLETRSPFLDHEFIEMVYRMPGDWKLKGLKGHKWILKRAFKDKLPQSIIKRGKMGFGSPIGPWFRGKLKKYWEDRVLSPTALARGYFDPKALRRMWEQHQNREWDHGYRLWGLLMLELWHEQYLADFKGFD